MRRKVLRLVLTLGILLLLFTTTVRADLRVVTFKNDRYTFKITIDDAFYLDADGDGFADDIRSYFRLNVKDINKESLLNLDITFRFILVLPSGNEFVHYISWTVTEEKINYELTLFNEAIESGYYDLYITMKTWDYGEVTGTAWINFDPPGGAGGNPDLMLLSY